MTRDTAAAKVSIRVTPRSSRSEVVRFQDGVLALRVQAPPVEGEANKAVRQLLADSFGLRLRDVTISHGDKSRSKTAQLSGLTQEQAEAVLAQWADED